MSMILQIKWTLFDKWIWFCKLSEHFLTNEYDFTNYVNTLWQMSMICKLCEHFLTNEYDFANHDNTFWHMSMIFQIKWTLFDKWVWFCKLREHFWTNELCENSLKNEYDFANQVNNFWWLSMICKLSEHFLTNNLSIVPTDMELLWLGSQLCSFLERYL